jgi:hypothetical protein
MSDDAITQLVAICAGIAGLAAFVTLVLVPVVSAYQHAWERVVAGLLTLWVLGALVGVGIAIGLGIVIYWPRYF